MKNKRIGLLQIFCFTFFLSHVLFLFFADTIIKTSKNDTIISLFLGLVLNIFLLQIFLFFFEKERKKTKRKLFLTIIFLVLFLFSIFLLKESSILVQQNFLKNGNFLAIFILFSILSFMISKRNMNQVASLALLSFFIFVPIFLFQLIGSATSLNFNFLKPPLATGILPVIKGALLFSLLSFLPLLLFFLLDKDKIDQKKEERKYITLGLIASNLVTILQFCMIALGPSLYLAQIYDYPYILVINRISSFLIFDRFSYLFSIFILFDSTITLGVLASLLKIYFPFPKNK